MSKKTSFDKVLRRYIREDGKPVGVVVAISPDNIGYSLCNIDAGDHFSKQKALSKAVGRATSQEKCDLNFWKSVVTNNVNKGKHKVSMDEVETYLGLPVDDKDPVFPFPTESGDLRELRALKEVKFMEERAKEYTW